MTDKPPQITPTYNQTSTAAATDVIINRTQTAVGSGAQKFIEGQIAGSAKFFIDTGGGITAATLVVTGITSGSGQISINGSGSLGTANATIVSLAGSTQTQTSGTNIGVSISRTFNQISSTAANTDVLINRTETHVGSGAQNFLDCQLVGSSKAKIDHGGNITAASITAPAGAFSTSLLIPYFDQTGGFPNPSVMNIFISLTNGWIYVYDLTHTQWNPIQTD